MTNKNKQSETQYKLSKGTCWKQANKQVNIGGHSDRLFMKLFKTNNADTVVQCQQVFFFKFWVVPCDSN